MIYYWTDPWQRGICLCHIIMKQTTKDKASLYFKIFQHNASLPTLANTKIAIWRNLLSIQNEAISVIAMRSKELRLVHKNHATVKPDQASLSPRGMKTYRESRIELRNPGNLQIFKKMLEKSSQFLSSEQPCEPKSLDVTFNIAGVQKNHRKLTCVCNQPRGHYFYSSFEWKESLWRWKFLSSMVDDSQISLI